jgi:hypothetical protein
MKIDNKFKNLVCISMSESSSGVIKYIIQKIKHYNIRIELFSVISKPVIMRLFSSSNEKDDFTEFNEAKKHLKIISNQIFSETGYRPEYNVVCGDFSDSLKDKILNDFEICSIILGAKNDSWNGKKLPSLMKKFFNFSTIPLVIIPQNITDIQINNIIYND